MSDIKLAPLVVNVLLSEGTEHPIPLFEIAMQGDEYVRSVTVGSWNDFQNVLLGFGLGRPEANLPVFDNERWVVDELHRNNGSFQLYPAKQTVI